MGQSLHGSPPIAGVMKCLKEVPIAHVLNPSEDFNRQMQKQKDMT